ncbi:MAG: hypothetical protein FJX52_10735, partial [Alphaproteobacteria bacterium]|nr:hypothetical protein [Alphaproteobacteria bacterium]
GPPMPGDSRLKHPGDYATLNSYQPRDSTDAAFVTLYSTGMANGLRSLTEEQRAVLEPRLARLEREHAVTNSFALLKAVAQREAFQARMNLFFESHDLLMTPTMPIPAFAAGIECPDASYKEWWEWSPLTYPFNFTIQPAASVPCGFTGSGSPVGLQIVGQRRADALVLRAARAYERTHPFRMPWDGVAKPRGR